eukprot:526419_1
MQYLKRLHRPLYNINNHLLARNNLLYLNRFSFSTINQTELLDLLTTHNNNRKDKSLQPPNPEHVEHLMDQIRTLDRDKNNITIPLELALNSCFFVTHYHTDKALNLPPDNVEDFVKFQEIHHKDMTIGWNLLDTPGDDINTFDASRTLWKIEMATRLEDTNKIYKSFMELYTAKNKDFNTFDDDQLMIGFSAIPYTGQWSLMLQLANVIKTKIPQAFISLYNMAQTLPIPDFTMIHDIVEQNEKFFTENEIRINDVNEIKDDSFDWNMYEFDNVQLKFKDLCCYKSMDDMNINIDKTNMVLNSMNDEMKGWKNVELKDDEETNEQGCNLRKTGCIAQARSFYGYGDMVPIQLYGPWIKNGIKVKGRVDIPIYNEEKKNEIDNEKSNSGNDMPVIVIIHEEEWDLKQDENNDRVFKGIYIVRQRNEILDKKNIKSDSEQMANFGPMDWVYDLEIAIK